MDRTLQINLLLTSASFESDLKPPEGVTFCPIHLKNRSGITLLPISAIKKHISYLSVRLSGNTH